MFSGYEEVRNSFTKAMPIINDVVTKFLESLFEDYPSAAELFENIDMDKFKSSMVNSMMIVASNLEKSDELSAYLKKLGGSPELLHISSEQYDMARKSLLKSFAYFFGEDWTDVLNQHWFEMLTLSKKYLIQGQQGADLKKKKEAVKSMPAPPSVPAPVAVKQDEPPVSINFDVSAPIEAPLEVEEAAFVSKAPEPVWASEDTSLAVEEPLIKSVAKQQAAKSTEKMEINMSHEAKSQSIIGDAIKSVDFSKVVPSKIVLPEVLLEKIRERASLLVKEAIEREFNLALERELQTSLQQGVDQLLNKAG